MLCVKNQARSPPTWKPTQDCFTCSVTALENVAVSIRVLLGELDVLHEVPLQRDERGPPPTPTSIFGLTRTRQSALTWTVCSWCVSGSDVPAKLRGLLKKNGLGTDPVMSDGSSSLKLVNVTAATRLCHARTPPPTANVGALPSE